MRVTVSGFHVPDGVTHIPPPLTGLRVAPSIRRQVITDCLGRDTPGTSINKLEEQLPQGPSNSRFLPPAKAVSQVVKHTRRVQRGGSIDDATRLDRLVRQHLIQRAYVLLYEPGYLLVMATLWSLELARSEPPFAATDAKCDTFTALRICSARSKQQHVARTYSQRCGIHFGSLEQVSYCC